MMHSRYARCNFCITVTDGPTITPSSKVSVFFFWFRFFTRFLCFLTAFYIPFVFPEFQRENFFGAFCGDTAVQPVVLSRSGTENPFGSTFCYGTDQVIVEVSRVISKASNSRQKNWNQFDFIKPSSNCSILWL